MNMACNQQLFDTIKMNCKKKFIHHLLFLYLLLSLPTNLYALRFFSCIPSFLALLSSSTHLHSNTCVIICETKHRYKFPNKSLRGMWQLLFY